MRRLFAILVCLFSTGIAVAALPVAVEGEPMPSLAPMLERTTPAVVNISAVHIGSEQNHPLLRDPFFRWFFDLPNQRANKKTQSLGSGLIVDAARGYVVTNQHVVNDADEIRVTMSDGRRLHAELVGEDPEIDIAVLKIPADRLHQVVLADSDKLRVGDFVVAIGSPFGLSQTVTSGIVSALGRSGLGIEGYENFIQTDASINPGNSGGPLVNLRGELVGINTAILAPNGSNVGIGFAIPSNIARAIIEQIIEYGGVNRGVFGITVQDLSADLANALGSDQAHGAVVSAIKPNSAADQAGLRVGDVVRRMNGRDIRHSTDMQTQLALLRIGAKFEIEILRDSRSKVLSAYIADPYADYHDGKQIERSFAGSRLNAVIDESLLGRNAGIAVGPVEPDSNAWRIGLREGDVLFEINRKRVKNLDALSAAAVDGVWQIKLRRGEQLLTLASH